MLVWVVETGEYSDRFILGVYDDPRVAQQEYPQPNTCGLAHKHGWQESIEEDGLFLSNWCGQGIEITPYEVITGRTLDRNYSQSAQPSAQQPPETARSESGSAHPE